jgi:hypothetical protein
MLAMSRRPPLIALAAAIALLAGLASCEASVGDGSRTQQLRAADQAAVVSTSLRARPATARRDRVELGSHAAVAATAFTLVPPLRAATDFSLPDPAAHGPHRHSPPARSRGPPRS